MIVAAPNMILVEGKQKSDSQVYIFAFNALDGSKIWQQEVASSPAQLITSNSILYRGTGGAGHVQSYRLTDGSLLWDVALSGAHSIVDLYYISDNLYANTNNDIFFTLSKDGTILNSELTTERVFYETDKTIYLGKPNAIEAKDKYSGFVNWHLDIADGFYYSPIFNQGKIYLRTWGTPDNIIYSIDQSSGRINWQLGTNALSNLCQMGTRLYYLSADGYLISLDSQSGQSMERIAFSPSFELNNGGNIGRYYVAADPSNNLVVVSFGDNDQILGIKIKPY
jgi:outer membrane protein assembly factor BamB